LESELGGELTIVFADDAESKALNSRYRKKEKPTDVLSFPSDMPGYLGDILISVPVAIKQSREYGVTLTDELTRLIVHGVLHLLGYEHEKVALSIARRMRRREEELLQVVLRTR